MPPVSDPANGGDFDPIPDTRPAASFDADIPPDADDTDAPPVSDRPPTRRRGVIPRDLLDEDAVFIVQRLQDAGHEAYLVGGCVRDLLCGLEPKDFDLATDAHPNRIKRLFRNARVIGRRFRLVHVRFPNNHVIEVSTFRADPSKHEAPTQDPEATGRRDWRDSVENIFGTAPEDAHRRDFTINALYYDPVADEVLDWVGGMPDIERKVIECIGEPTERIHEDPVRMLRAVHFAKRLGFELETSLAAAIRAEAACLNDASQARLYVELVKLLSRRRARETISMLHDLGVLQLWLPELCEAFDDPMPGEDDVTVGEETLAMLGSADAWGMSANEAPESLALSALFGPWLLSTVPANRRMSHTALSEHFDATFREVAVRMSIPRWASTEMREILLAQASLCEPPAQPRRLQTFMRRRAFPVALQWFAFQQKAAGEDATAFEAWIERAEDAGIRSTIARPAERIQDRARQRNTRRGGRDRKSAGRGGRGRDGGRDRGEGRSRQGRAEREQSRDAEGGKGSEDGKGSEGSRRSRATKRPRDVTPEADAWMPPPEGS